MSAPGTPPLSTSLMQYFGFDQFRDGQEETIQSLLQGHSSLAIFPTGSGKSLCYQLTALHLPHLTLVVSPLLALMKDQVEFLRSKNIAAASLDSSLTFEENQRVMQGVRNGEIKILMVSVERFKNERFRQFIDSIAISLLVVDEAHCISEWGHNFRPDYLKLPDYCAQLNIPQVLLLTATATKTVKKDMAAKFAISPDHIHQTGFYRDNLHLKVLPVLASEKQRQLYQSINAQQGAGIVYVTLQHSAQLLADFLCAQGINAAAYHAGLANDVRVQVQNQFMHNKIDVVVATIAFGMGVDKSNIRFVIHYDLPKSIENYSQEIGRAGRDGSISQCITLANLDGVPTLENFVYGDTPERQGIQALITHIIDHTDNGQYELQVHSLATLCNIRQLPLKTLLVQLELRNAIKPVYAYFAELKIKLLEDQQAITGRFAGERGQFLQAIFSHTEFKRTWGVLNIDALLRDQKISRQRVIAALEYLQEQGSIELQSSQMTDVYQVNQAIISERGLTDELYQYFTDKEQKEIKRIASLIRFFELDSCLASNLARYFDDQGAPAACGHCSVCQGQPAKLNYSSTTVWPSDEHIRHALTALSTHLASKSQQPISIASYTRFLAGISVPAFARFRVKQVPGFASLEQLRYSDIYQKVSEILPDIN